MLLAEHNGLRVSEVPVDWVDDPDSRVRVVSTARDDLKDEEGREASRALIRTADVVLHNFPPDRAQRFDLDREGVREINPEAVWCCVSALGSDGPEAALTAFDLVAQALSGLLLANAQGSASVPQRAGGIAMADFTAGLLAVIAVLAGLMARGRDGARGLEVSLLGAALAVQAQRFVSVEALDRGPRERRKDGPGQATADDLERHARFQQARDLACLHERQRVAAAGVLGLEDPWAANPQASPGSADERERRLALVAEFERRLATEPVALWVKRFRAAGVPAAEVRALEQLFEHDQVRANGLVHTLAHGPAGPVKLLGSLFKIDGASIPPGRSVPALSEHTEEVLAECRQSRS